MAEEIKTPEQLEEERKKKEAELAEKAKGIEEAGK